MNVFLDDLNESQRAAVLYDEGPSLVIAGAGSGKTRVLTYKIVALLEKGYSPFSIMALTFTNKAAREMKERIAQLISPEQASRLWMGTFHSIFSRILRKEASYLGFNSNFTIYDANDTKSLLKTIVKDLNLDDKKYKNNVLYSRISQAKNALISPENYEMNRQLMEWDYKDGLSQIKDIYKIYVSRCKAAQAMDFDDLLFYTNRLFEENPEILEKYQSFFQYILVDEYQDTNFSQYQIVKRLVALHKRFCIVGDDAQSIYSFRGANIENILSFKKDYPDGKIFKLEQNYRSTQTIVNAANSLIENNKYQIKKTSFSLNGKGNQISVLSAFSDLEEGMLVSNKINELCLTSGYRYNDFAVLYRTNAQSRVFEEEFRRKGIPYIVYGGLSFYQRKEIKDLIAYFRLVVNPQDEEAFKRVINYPARGIGDTTLLKLRMVANEAMVSIWEVASDPEQYALDVNKGTKKKLSDFTQMIQLFREMQTEHDVYTLGMKILSDTGMRKHLSMDITPEGTDRLNNINELLNGINEFVNARKEIDESADMSSYLSEISLLTDQDSSDDISECVTLMTVHASKGLEFANVIVAGLEEDLFPSSLSKNALQGLEEERRLLYVAITRAKENCCLSFARSRLRNGTVEVCRPSRFLKEIDRVYLSLPMDKEPKTVYQVKKTPVLKPLVEKPRLDAKEKNVPMSSYNKMYNLAVGDKIEHERFGVGEVLALEGEAENSKAKVNFLNAGEKQLLLKFARFKKV